MPLFTIGVKLLRAISFSPKTVWRTTAVGYTEKTARYLYFLQYPGFTDRGARD